MEIPFRELQHCNNCNSESRACLSYAERQQLSTKVNTATHSANKTGKEK